MGNKWTESFLQESEDLLAQIEDCALAVSNGEATADTVAQLFRGFHTIKGSGAMCGLEQVASFTHHIETLLDDIREGRVPLSPQVAELVLASVDQIRSLLAQVASDSELSAPDEELIAKIRQVSAARETIGKPAVGKPGQAPPKPSDPIAAPKRTWQITFLPDPGLFACGANPLALLRELRTLGEAEITANTERIPPLAQLQPGTCYLGWSIALRTSAGENEIRDVFLFVEDGAELTIAPVSETPSEVSEDAPPTDAATVVEKATTAPAASPGTSAASRTSANSFKSSAKDSVVRVPSARLDRLVNLVGELVMNQSRLAQAVQMAGAAELANPVQEMERLVAELRDDVLGIRMLPIGTIFGRFQRLVHDLSAELGKEAVLLTEGAETELDKSILDQLGEPLVHLLRNSIDHGIEPADDRVTAGKPRHGTIRLSAFHRGSDVVVSIEDDGRGINRGTVRAKAISRNLVAPDAALSDKELLNLILLPGFSTAEQVTNVSGRGVGLDVVKKQIDTFRGSLSIKSDEGKGTTIALSLPLTLAIIEGLIVQIGADQFIIPMAAITENVELDRAQRGRNNGRNVVAVRGELISYIDLREAFSVEGEPPPIEKVVIVSHEEGRVGLVVDRVLGTHQTVLQSLGRFFRNIDVVSGATILGDGRVALIMDIPAIVRYVEKQHQEAEQRQSPALQTV